MRQHDLQTLKITWLEMISNPRSLNQPTLRVDHGEWGQVQIQIRVGGIKPPATRTSIVADTFGSNYDTVLSAWTGTSGALNLLACNDDFNGGQSQKLFGNGRLDPVEG